MDDSPMSPIRCNSFEAGSFEKSLLRSMLLKSVSHLQLIPSEFDNIMWIAVLYGRLED